MSLWAAGMNKITWKILFIFDRAIFLIFKFVAESILFTIGCFCYFMSFGQPVDPENFEPLRREYIRFVQLIWLVIILFIVICMIFVPNNGQYVSSSVDWPPFPVPTPK
ncbi:hypothetical protein BVY01_00920 [bacterium I07]|nr:hypothetical protein BVY01_00920 [bacterium I07]